MNRTMHRVARKIPTKGSGNGAAKRRPMRHKDTGIIII